MARKHIILYPSGQGVDFFRAERSYDGIYLRSGTASWLPTLMPSILAQIDAISFVFSSFRQVPLCDPAILPLPAGQGYAVKILAPCGGYYPQCWGSILFHSENHPPAVAGEKFVPENGGIRRQVREFFSEDFVDLMRKPDRPRVELWVRPDLEIEAMLPNAYDAPRWLRETFGLSAQEAAQKMSALRFAAGSGEYEALRRKEKAAREAAAQAEEDAAFEERRKAWEAEIEAQMAVRQYADGLAGVRTELPDFPLPSLADPQQAPEPSYREKVIEAKKLKAKISKATQAQVRATKANEESAKQHADKVVARMTKEGRL